ncbi:hypothetical protein Tco_0601397 [Tanacetum coccineum]
MYAYLNNMEGYKLKDLKLKQVDSIQEMFDRAFKRQKVEDDKKTIELKQCLEIILDEEEVIIDAIPLAIKSPSIIGWKINKEGRKSYYQIMRANGKSQTYMIFSQMLKSFNRQDLEDLYKLVKAKYESTRPVEDLDLLLCGDLKTMFEPHVEDNAILASSSEVPSVLEFLQRRKLEAKKEVAASEFSHLNHSLSHRPVSVKPDISKPDISKASSAGGKLHILKPSCERNGITPTPKESLSPTSGSKVPNSPLTGESNLLIVKASAD